MKTKNICLSILLSLALLIPSGSSYAKDYAKEWPTDVALEVVSPDAPSDGSTYGRKDGAWAVAGHDAVTLDANADTLLSLSTQELGLDTQTANYVFSGPASGAAAAPTFRALVADDIPDLSGTYLTAESDPLSLLLDQATPQHIINGFPRFDAGIGIVGNYGLYWRDIADANTVAYVSYDGDLNFRTVGVSSDMTFASGSGEISFDNDNLTTTGTIQGEQLTSTDDTDIADKLTVNHIGEHTVSHNVVIDNNVKIITGADTYAFTEEFSLTGWGGSYYLRAPVLSGTLVTDAPGVPYTRAVVLDNFILVRDYDAVGEAQVNFMNNDFTTSGGIGANLTDSYLWVNWDFCPDEEEKYSLGHSDLRWVDLWLSGKSYFRDSNIYIESTDDGHLDLNADTSIDLNGDVVIGDANTYVTFNTVTNPDTMLVGTFNQLSSYSNAGAENIIYSPSPFFFDNTRSHYYDVEGVGGILVSGGIWDVTTSDGDPTKVGSEIYANASMVVQHKRTGTINSYNDQVEVNATHYFGERNNATYSGSTDHAVLEMAAAADVVSNLTLNSAGNTLTHIVYGVSSSVEVNDTETAGTLNESICGVNASIDASGVTITNGSVTMVGLNIDELIGPAGATVFGIYDNSIGSNWKLADVDKYIEFNQSTEKIGSDDAGHLDLFAATSIDLNIGTTEQIVLTDGKLSPTTNNDIDLGDSTHKFKDVFIGTLKPDAIEMALDELIELGDGEVNIASLDDGHLDLTADVSIDLNGAVDAGANSITTSGAIGGGAITGTSLTDGTATLDDGSLTGAVNGTFSGTVTVGGFKLTNSPTAGHVLTSDADGNGTWQAGGAGSQTPWASDIDGGGYDLTNAGTAALGGLSVSSAPTITNNTAATGSMVNGLLFNRTTDGTASAGIGSQILWQIEDNAGGLVDVAAEKVSLVSTTNGSHQPYWQLYTWDAGDLKRNLELGVDRLFTVVGPQVDTGPGIPLGMEVLDDSTSAADVGGGIGLTGYINTTPNEKIFAAIRGLKENGITDNYDGYLPLYTRVHGGDLTECIRWNSNQDTFLPSGKTLYADNITTTSTTADLSLKAVGGDLTLGSDQLYALWFDASGDYVTVANDSSNNASYGATAYSMECWVYIESDGQGDNGRIYAKRGNANNAGAVLSTTGQTGSTLTLAFRIDRATTDCNIDVSNVSINTWHHYVVSWNGGDGTGNAPSVYLDGILRSAAGAATGGAGTIVDDTSNSLFIGDSQAHDRCFDGAMKLFRIYRNKALSAAEVSTLYSGGTVAGDTAEYLFTEGTGTSLADSSGNSNNGTITNAVWLNNESINLNFTTTPNTVAVSSSTGVTTMEWGSLSHTTTGSITGRQFNTYNVYPQTDDTYYVGKNDDDSPLAYKGIILKDTTNGKYYRIEIINGVITPTDLTD